LFEGLAERLQATFRRLRGQGKLTEKNIQDGLREVKLALLEADVNYKVVRDFIRRVEQQAVGQEVLRSITPGQQVVKIVHQALTELMGQQHRKLELAANPPTVIMLVGLQGSGKTTTAAKLARWFLSSGRRPLLVAADPYRPAAVEQLKVLAEQVGVGCFTVKEAAPPVKTCLEAVRYAKVQGLDPVIVDTAGRRHMDEVLMLELQELKKGLAPQHVVLVADAMTGQEAVNLAQGFDKAVGLTGVILTKTEGDARGGAALSIRAVTGKPIHFVGVGEKLDALEAFHPERMASRILGMGDILTLVEKAEAAYSQEKAEELKRRLRTQEFTLEDFLEQLKQIKKMGPLDHLLEMLPGSGNIKKMRGLAVDERQLVRTEAIINSMTPEERRNYKIINGSRRRRIARGSGTSVQEVNRLLKNFMQMQRMLKALPKGSRGGWYRLRLPV